MATIAVKSVKTGRAVSFEKDLGDNLDAAIALYGAEAVHSLYIDQAVIRCQAGARNTLDKAEHSEADAIAAGQAFTPGVRAPRGVVTGASAQSKVLADIASGKMGKSQVEAYLAKLMDAAKAIQAAQATAKADPTKAPPAPAGKGK